MKKFVCMLFLIFLPTVLYARKLPDTLSFREEFLFIIDCTVSDIRRQERPTPCLSIAHDSLIVFPSHRDTITFFKFNGEIVKKTYNKLKFFPTHIYYSNEEKLIYLMSVGTWSTILDTLIYAINLDGEVKKKYKMRHGNMDQWFFFTQQLTKDQARLLKEQFHIKNLIDYYANSGVAINILYDLSAIADERYVLMDRCTPYSLLESQKNVEEKNNRKYTVNHEYYKAYDFAMSRTIVLKTTAADTLYYSGDKDISRKCDSIEWYGVNKPIGVARSGMRKEKRYIQVKERGRSFVFTTLFFEK